MADRSPWLTLWEERVDVGEGRTLDGFNVIEAPDYAVVFALTEDGRVLAMWHYKHGPRALTLGLPAGFCEPGESPLDCARRELLEETGHTATEWSLLGAFAVDGNRGMGTAHAFIARGCRKVGEPTEGDLEEYRMELLAPTALRQHLVKGDLRTLGAAATAGLGLLHIQDEMRP